VEPIGYLGDGVYVVLQNGMIELRANDLENPTDIVYLERNVLQALIQFATTHNFLN